MTEREANEATAAFEAGYPHHHTYYVEHRYMGDEIEPISAVVSIRQRHELYVGPGGAQLSDLVFEAMCLSLTEAHCGTVSTISVNVNGLDIEVTDDGLGLSLQPDRNGLPFAEAVMTTLYACRDHKQHERLKREVCRFGIVVVNALSSTASLGISHGAARQEQHYTCGQANGPFTKTGTSSPRGTTLRFSLEPRFLLDDSFDPHALRTRIGQLSMKLEGLTLHIGAYRDEA